METATATRTDTRSLSSGLHHSNQVAAFNHTESRAVVAARVKDCVGRALHAVGSSAAMQQTIYWNLSVTKSLGPDDIVDKPSEFIEGLRGIFGEAGIVVLEYMITREVKREFGLTSAFDDEVIQGKGLPALLQFISVNLVRG